MFCIKIEISQERTKLWCITLHTCNHKISVLQIYPHYKKYGANLPSMTYSPLKTYRPNFVAIELCQVHLLQMHRPVNSDFQRVICLLWHNSLEIDSCQIQLLTHMTCE